MSLGTILLALAQLAAPAIAEAPAGSARALVAVSAAASVRVLRPAIVRASAIRGAAATGPASHDSARQRRDTDGTIWIEFH